MANVSIINLADDPNEEAVIFLRDQFADLADNIEREIAKANPLEYREAAINLAANQELEFNLVINQQRRYPLHGLTDNSVS